MYVARAQPGGIHYGHGSRCRNRDGQPDQGRQGKSRKCREFENQCVSGCEMMDDSEGQQEDSGGNRRQRNETDINSAMQPLA